MIPHFHFTRFHFSFLDHQTDSYTNFNFSTLRSQPLNTNKNQIIAAATKTTTIIIKQLIHAYKFYNSISKIKTPILQGNARTTPTVAEAKYRRPPSRQKQCRKWADRRRLRSYQDLSGGSTTIRVSKRRVVFAQWESGGERKLPFRCRRRSRRESPLSSRHSPLAAVVAAAAVEAVAAAPTA